MKLIENCKGETDGPENHTSEQDFKSRQFRPRLTKLCLEIGWVLPLALKSLSQ